MNYNNIIKYDACNGSGLRTTLFVTGCEFYCENCFNRDIWDFNSGKLYNGIIEAVILDHCSDKHIKGLSILGGEPLHRKNIGAISELVINFKELYIHKDIWLWTGYTFEELIYLSKKFMTSESFIFANALLDILHYVDIIVDGRFESDKKDLSLKFRGSNNQRIIDVQKSLRYGKVIEMEEFY